MRVEQALRLMPDLETLLPLRALLLSLARPDRGAEWGSAGPYLTVGKRTVDPAQLRDRLGEVQARVAEHVTGLFNAYVDALEGQQRGDLAGAVSALLRASEQERAAWRLPPAAAWGEVALAIAVEMHTREPELECLERLGSIALRLNQYPDAGRYYQRALALAEAEFNQQHAIAACEGLGQISFCQGQWAGAQAWYGRGLRLAESSGDPRAVGQLNYRFGVLARGRGDFTAAGEHLRKAREQFEVANEPLQIARALKQHALVEADLGRPAAAMGAYLEALAWVPRGGDRANTSLEIGIRIHLGMLHLESGKLLEAETEFRRAEDMALEGFYIRRLVQAYAFLGRLRGIQKEETGFVFFEQALEICRMSQCSPALVAQVHREYAAYLNRTGAVEAARAHLERAGEIFEALGEQGELEQVRARISELSA